MGKFKSAFNDGIEAARKAHDSKEEVQAVFNAVNRELSDFNVRIAIAEVTEQIDFRGMFRAEMFRPPAKYKAIVANSLALTSNKPAKVLARWTQEPAGYPCRITLPQKEIFCENKKGLEEGLVDLLKDVMVGESLVSLMNEGTRDVK